MMSRLLALLLACLFGGSAFGQRVSGRLSDAGGEPLPFASIKIKDAKGVQHITRSNDTGNYVVRDLAVGACRLQCSFLGYVSVDTTFIIGTGDIPFNLLLRPRPTLLSEVEVVSSATAQTVRNNALSVETADRNQIERSGSGTLSQALAKLPGVATMTNGVGIAKPVIRGMSFNRILVNENGIKQEGQQWGADHGLEIDPYNVDRVEILKGPSSLLYGSDGIGGVVNIRPGPAPMLNSLGGSSFTTYKSNNNLAGQSVMMQGNRRDVFFRLRYSYQNYGDYHVPADSFVYNRYVLPIYGHALKNTAGRENDISAMVGIRRQNLETRLTLTSFHQLAGLFPGSHGIPRFNQITPDASSRNIDLPRQLNSHVKLISNTVWQLGRSTLEADIGFQRNNRREDAVPHSFNLGPQTQGNLSLGLLLQTYTANIRYIQQHSARLKTTVGVSGQSQQNQASGYEFLLPAFNASQTGAYAFAQYQPHSKITLSGGIRADRGAITISQATLPVYGDSTTIIGYDNRVAAAQRTFANLSYSVGGVCNPSEALTIRFNLGKSFRVPNPTELSTNGVHHGTFRHEKGNENLKSEFGYQADLGIVYSPGKVTLKGSPFYSYFPSYIYLRPSGQFSTLPDAGQIYAYTQSMAESMGFEATAEYRPWRFLRFASVGEYVQSTNLESGLPLPFIPPFSLLNQAEFSLDYKTGALRSIYLLAEYHVFAAQDRTDRNEPHTPGYALVDISAGAVFLWGRTPLKLNAMAANLADVRYLNHLSRYRILNLPEQGRNFILSLSVPFTLLPLSAKPTPSR